MTDSISAQVKQVLVDTLDVDFRPGDIDDRLSLYSTTISLDSLTLLRLITELERVFGCEIDDEAVMSADLVDVGSLVELVLGQLDVAGVAMAQADPAGQGVPQ
ncbi:acyl carrier protein [Streptomyces apocyni]|uniref:acyl carrier protein n=1 Tax=Streptomyces apocyni TaxID=2654677 RepID=UPI0012E9940D|nr:acyl carrier protein [Streptomyces apocyni]